MTSLLHPRVEAAIVEAGITVRELACSADFADTAAFMEEYGFTSEQSANTILVASKKVEPAKYAVCVVLASTKLDVNKKVRELLGVRKASFADGDTTVQLTDMQIGGVTAIGIADLPIYVDSAVMEQSEVVMGGGNRTSKVVLAPSELLKLPNVEVIADLAKVL